MLVTECLVVLVVVAVDIPQVVLVDWEHQDKEIMVDEVLLMVVLLHHMIVLVVAAVTQ